MDQLHILPFIKFNGSSVTVLFTTTTLRIQFTIQLRIQYITSSRAPNTVLASLLDNNSNNEGRSEKKKKRKEEEDPFEVQLTRDAAEKLPWDPVR